MTTATESSTVRFVTNQLFWTPDIIGNDGKSMGAVELLVSESIDETEKTVNALLRNIEMQGADAQLTLNKEISNLRNEANKLSDSLRQSRSITEAVQNGERLRSIMLLLRAVELYYRFYMKGTGTSGD